MPQAEASPPEEPSTVSKENASERRTDQENQERKAFVLNCTNNNENTPQANQAGTSRSELNEEFKQFLQDCHFAVVPATNIADCQSTISESTSLKQAVLVNHCDTEEINDQLKGLLVKFENCGDDSTQRLLIVCGKGKAKEILSGEKTGCSMLTRVFLLFKNSDTDGSELTDIANTLRKNDCDWEVAVQELNEGKNRAVKYSYLQCQKKQFCFAMHRLKAKIPPKLFRTEKNPHPKHNNQALILVSKNCKTLDNGLFRSGVQTDELNLKDALDHEGYAMDSESRKCRIEEFDDEDAAKKQLETFLKEKNQTGVASLVIILADSEDPLSGNIKTGDNKSFNIQTRLTEIANQKSVAKTNRLAVVHLRNSGADYRKGAIGDRPPTQPKDGDQASSELYNAGRVILHRQSGLVLVQSESRGYDSTSPLGSRFILALCSAIYFGAGEVDVASMIGPINSIVRNGFSNDKNFEDESEQRNGLPLPYWIVQTTGKFFLDDPKKPDQPTAEPENSQDFPKALVIAQKPEPDIDKCRIALEANGWEVHAEYGNGHVDASELNIQEFKVIVASERQDKSNQWKQLLKLNVFYLTNDQNAVNLLKKACSEEAFTICSCARDSVSSSCNCKQFCKNSKGSETADHNPLICANCKICVNCNDQLIKKYTKSCKKCGKSNFHCEIEPNPKVPVPECHQKEKSPSEDKALWKLSNQKETNNSTSKIRALIINNFRIR